MNEGAHDPWRNAWLARAEEPVLEPDRRIIDPHFHVWEAWPPAPYMEPELLADMATSGHRIVAGVFIECGYGYDHEGDDPFGPVKEVELVRAMSDRMPHGVGETRLGGIVGHADLKLGDRVRSVLDAQAEAGRGLFRGIRQTAAYDPSGLFHNSHDRPADFYGSMSVREGLRALASMGLTFDAWHYHTGSPAFIELVRALPDVPFILDHHATPLLTGPYAGREAEVFADWRGNMAALASCPNVVVKIGGITMEAGGFDGAKRAEPQTSDTLAEIARPFFEETVALFGPERCMFESNFPADKACISYRALWNAWKKLAASLSEDEKDALFFGTAARVYRISTVP